MSMDIQELKRWGDVDIGEMLGMAYMSKEAGFPKVQMDTEHAIELLEGIAQHRAEIESLRKQLEEAKEETRRTLNGWKANVELIRSSREADIERTVRITCKRFAYFDNLAPIVAEVLAQLNGENNA